jgi:hypothetical protein
MHELVGTILSMQCDAIQQCRPFMLFMQVPNITGAAVEYQVMCSLECVAGPAALKLTGVHGGSYKITAAPTRSGVYVGTLTFKTQEGQYVWYSLEVRASEPPEVGAIAVRAPVHGVTAITIRAANPLPEAATLDVRYSHPDCLVGPAQVQLQPASQVRSAVQGAVIPRW